MALLMAGAEPPPKTSASWERVSAYAQELFGLPRVKTAAIAAWSEGR